MKLLFLSALVALALSHLLEAAHKDALDAKWELFKIAHAKNYQLDTEEQERKEVFLKNLKFIAEHNDRYEKKLVSFTVGINKYADLTTHEFAAMMNGYNQLDRTQRTGDPFDASKTHLPESVDWRLKGAVTRVKDQKQCGACWAFSATGSLEGQHFLRKGQLVSLSEQNLIDCSKNDDNAGCHGGTMDAAFKYVKKNKGIDTEQSYPYEAKDGKCRYNPNNNAYTDYGYVDIPEGSEAALKKAVAKVGPISVGIDAGHDSFQLYRSGVYNDLNCSSTDLTHGVLVVGYGTAKEGGDYWLVKNSWGTDWGMNGYFLLARNQNNTCGIATMASYPKVK